MAQQIINIGNVPDDGKGDKLRPAFQKVNANFTELYATGGGLPDSGVVPGSYTNANLTVNAQGLLTAASNGGGGGGSGGGLVNINSLLTVPFNPDGKTSNLPMVREFNRVVQKFAPEFPVPVNITVGSTTVLSLDASIASGGTQPNPAPHYLKPNQAFHFNISAGGSLPAGIDTATTYYIRAGTPGTDGITTTTFTFSTVNNFGYDTSDPGFTNEGPAVATSGGLIGTASIVLTGRDVNLFIPQGPYFGTNYGSGPSEWLTPNGLTRIRYFAHGAMFDSGISFGSRWYTAEAKTWTRVSSKVKTTTTVINDGFPFDSIITLITPSEASFYHINGWIAILCLDTQDHFGAVGSEPPNNHFHEYKRIKAINPATGDITLDGALKWVYLSTFPDVSQATSPGLIGGGAALIAPMHPNWDTEIEIIGVRYCGEAPEAFARSVTFQDCAFQGFADFPAQAAPTAAQSYIYRNCRFGPSDTPGSNYMEVDKMLEYLEIDNCVAFNHYTLLFQSTSVHLAVIKSFRGAGIAGTPRQLRITDSDIDGLRVGPYIGVTDSLSIFNSRFTFFDMLDRNDDNDSLFHNNDMQLVPNWAFSNGTFTRDISNIGNQSTNWIIPGAKIYMTDAGNVFKRYQNMGSMFAILDTSMTAGGVLSFRTTLKALPTRMTSSAVTISIATPAVITWTAHILPVGAPVALTTSGTLPTGLQTGNQYYVAASPAPTANTFSLTTTLGGGGTAVATSGSQSGTHTAWGNPLCFRPHPCTRFTGIGNGGCPAILDHNGAIDEPLYSRIRRGFGGIQGDISGSGPALQQPNPRLWGFLKSMIVTVFTPVSVGTLTITSVGFQQPNLDLGTGGNFSQTINVAIAGQRIVTNLAVTGNQTGDVLAAYPHWLAGPVLFNWSVGTSATLAASAQVLVEMFTDQGVARFSNMWGAPAAPLSTFNLWAWTDSGIVQQYGSTP